MPTDGCNEEKTCGNCSGNKDCDHCSVSKIVRRNLDGVSVGSQEYMRMIAELTALVRGAYSDGHSYGFSVGKNQTDLRRVYPPDAMRVVIGAQEYMATPIPTPGVKYGKNHKPTCVPDTDCGCV